MRSHILVAFGTRPEVIKLAPLIEALRRRPDRFALTVVLTSQHRDLVRPLLRFFDIRPDHDLDVMTHAQTPADVASTVLHGLDALYESIAPDCVVVQGDTVTTMAAALAAFYRRVPVAHVEAGLRTEHRYDPYPEEMNRRLVSQIASLHFAATEANRAALLRENIDAATVHVTGNTVVDALHSILGKSGLDGGDDPAASIETDGRKLILLTTHRRENFGEPQRNIFAAISDLLTLRSDIDVVFPMHPNPQVVQAAREALPSHERLHLVDPPDYVPFVRLMRRAHIILTDSGGIQEEAPILGVPVVVLRRTTERQELIDAGNGVMAGVVREDIVRTVLELLDNPERYRRMATAAYPFGTLGASERITEILAGNIENASGKGEQV